MSSLFSRWKQGLAKTSKASFQQITNLLNTSEITDSIYNDLEELLIQGDVGVFTSQIILRELRQSVNNHRIKTHNDLMACLRDILQTRIERPSLPLFENNPFIILIVGVNGSGKTTTIAKLSSYFEKMGKSVLLGAADTYRAAAIEQLSIWAERLKIPIICGQPSGDSGAVVYDTVKSAIARNSDIVIIDTAGRLHTRYNLMEELKKVFRVTSKAMIGAPHAVWLVIDATTGQNALQQSKAFKEAVNVNGIIMAKLDTSAKGGMVFSIQDELQLPILFVGLGEKIDDFELFDPDAFIDGILGENTYHITQ